MAALVEGTQAIEVEQRVLRRDDCDVSIEHARPEGMPKAGIVVCPDIFGSRALFTDMAGRLASHGFAVALVEPFARVDFELRAAHADDAPTRMSWVSSLDDDDQLGDLEAAANLLVVEDDVTHVGVLGFCMGGMYTLKASKLERFDAAVAFYGMIRVPQHWQGAGQGEPLAGIEHACKSLAIFGSVDPYSPEDEIAALRAAWRDRPDCEVIVIEGAEHGFVHAPERPAHRADDAAALWSRTLDWLS